MIYETISYFLFTDIINSNYKEEPARLNNDIYCSIFQPMFSTIVRKYLDDKICYIPTYNQYQTDKILKALKRGVGYSGFSTKHIVTIDEHYRKTGGPLIIVGEASRTKELTLKVDWSFLYPMLSHPELQTLLHISNSVCFPVPCNTIPWYNTYMNWFLAELDRSTQHDYFKTISQY